MAIFLLFFLGASLGSFIGLIWNRFPQNSILLPASHCEQCKTPLQIRDLVPVLSILINHYKCRFCHKPINSIYFFLEIFCGICLVMTYYKYVISWTDLFFIYFALLLSLYDTRDYSYSFIVWLLFTSILLFTFPINQLFCILLLLAFYAEWRKAPIASGDFLFLTSLSLIYPLSQLLWIVEFGSVFAIVFCFISHKRKIPFIPFLSLGFILTLLLHFLQ